jgi:anti-sigma factor RsiW
MMEKESAYKSFEKKITPYLDGSLSKEDTAEFEAFVHTHPEFEEKIQTKRHEIEVLKSYIPSAVLSAEARSGLEEELKASVYNLLKEEQKSLWDNLRIKWEEWLNR